MKSYKELLQEAEGFQGKFTPSKDTMRQAIDVGRKVNPARQQPIPKGRAIVPSPGGKVAVNPRAAARDKAVSMAGNFIKRKAGEAVNKGVTNVLAKREGHKEPKPRGQARGYMTSPDTTTKSRTRPVNKQAQARRAVKKGLKGTAAAAAGAAKQIAKGIRGKAPIAKQPGGAKLNAGEYNRAKF